PLAVRGFNAEGLRRRQFSETQISAVKQMHKLLYRTGKTLAQATAEIAELAHTMPQAAADVALMGQFLAQSTRGIAR
ncbi:MAG: hypothetical protein RL535_1565, partial [Pseudomonadota bacterium]